MKDVSINNRLIAEFMGIKIVKRNDEDVINYCLNWRKEWLNNELSKVYL